MLPGKTSRFARFWRDFLKLLQISDYHPETYDHIRSYPALVAERHRHQIEVGSYIIHPYSLFSFGWNSFMIPINIFHMVISTFRLCLIIDDPYIRDPHPLDLVLVTLNIVCFLDMLLKFNIGYPEKPLQIVIMNRRLIAGHYIRRWFLIDLISCLPIAYLLLELDIYNTRYLLFSHFFGIVRILKIATVVNHLIVFMKLFTSSYCVYGSVRQAVLYLLSSHWCTCLIYVPPVFKYYWTGKMPTTYTKFLDKFNSSIFRFDYIERYTKGLFVVCTAFFGTGFSMFVAYEPDEAFVHGIIIIYAAMFNVYNFVCLLKIYMTLYDSTIRYNDVMDQVEEYMRSKQFPAALKKRVRAFYKYTYQGRYYREQTIRECLSEELSHEITLHTCHKLVDKVALFENIPASVVGTILGCLRPEVYLPNDSVVRAGDFGDSMYFIASGTVAVYSLKGVEICHLEDGAHFGEIALLMKDRKRVATVVAVEITEVYRLNAHDFTQFILPNQELYKRIDALASKRMHETVLLDEAFLRERDRLNEQQKKESTTTKPPTQTPQ
ncbi:hypothetical protein K1T71_006494 [Dendrolimus kikuchii]|uniref:Uncharacterized protein n=1 Tax=Dendrolimus kikuchii TaxID=765133 RepID=A0ACC1D1A1_9NEOP|nr:hypothetical protein K1T71_006494 [Dendrolimus kikuchii]